MTIRETQKTEADRIKEFTSDFFTSYYTERNCDKVMSCFADRMLFVGAGEEEVARDRESCRRLVQKQMDNVPYPIPYFIMEYSQTSGGNGTWVCFARIELNVVSPEWGTAKYNIRLTLTVCPVQGGWRITALHVSEAGQYSDEKRTFTKKSEAAKIAAQREIGRIMSQVVPGGIVSRYVNSGSPISIVNEEYLRMVGHPTFYDFMADCSGLFERIIHPDDLEKFLYTVRFIITSGKQSECGYRIRRSDGTYFWVHDTGRKAVSTDGKDLVVSVLTDMSDQVERRRQLERESETDELTSVYNRRGAMNHYREMEQGFEFYAGFLLDVDNFKLVNDLYGHKQGDRTLRHVAELLSEKYGREGIVCRLGGDEFSVFIPNCTDLEGLQKDLREMISGFRAEMEAACPEAGCSLSIGGVYGRKPLSLEQTFSTADANLYAVKRDQKSDLLITKME